MSLHLPKRIESLQLMKTRLGIFKLLVILCSAFATTAVLGQITYTWTGAGDGTNFNNPLNWNPNGIPNPNTADTAQWDGITTSNLFITFSSGPMGGGAPLGINFVLTANQTNSVDLYSAVYPIAGYRAINFSIASGAGAFSLGDDGSNALYFIMGAFNGEIQNFVNNSSNAATIYPNVRWAQGGGGSHTFVFDGSGDWNVNNSLVGANGANTLVTKQGSGTMTWAGANVPNSVGNSAIASPLTINGGALSLESSDLLTNQAIANNATLIYDAAAGACTLSGVISGTGALQVNSGQLTLSGTNTYAGGTTISGGTLRVGAGGASGSLGSGNITNNGSLDFNRTGTLTVGGTISGSGSVTNDGSGTVILVANNSYTGGTTINAGTLQIGNGGASGALDANSPIFDNGLLVFNSSAAQTYAGPFAAIGGTGNVSDVGSGLVEAVGANTYTGWTFIGPGATFQPCFGNQGQLLSSVVTNNGTLKLVRLDNGFFTYSGNIVGTGSLVKDVNNLNPGDVTLLGANTYTGGTFIAGGAFILGDGVTPGTGAIVGNVIFTNSASSSDTPRTLEFNRPDNVTFSGVISGSGSAVPANMGSVVQNGSGTLTLTANNDYAGGTTINTGKLVFQGTKSGSGNITVADGAALGVYATGTQITPDTLMLGSSSGCALEFNNLNSTTTAPLTAGTLSSAGTVTININSGAFTVGQSYPLLTWTTGSPPAVSLAILSDALGNLSTNGNTIQLNITVAPPTLAFTQTGSNLQFSWTGSFKLQAQTNSLNVGVSTNWTDYPGGGTSPVTLPMDATQGTVFFRLVSP